MQDDKNFKELMMKCAVEETSQDFTAETLRRIEALSATKTSQPLINHTIKQAFIIGFAIVLTALLAISLFIKPADLPFNFIQIPTIRVEVFYNLISFILAFWVLMFLNYYLQNRNTKNNWV